LRIAALDLGSNSFHLLVVEARLDGSFVPLAREREMLRLGDVVARTGAIGEESTMRAIGVLRRFRSIYESQRADEVVALWTGSTRRRGSRSRWSTGSGRPS
jgi:exopolyphosphatase/guanosine-5'-triphosphate,3'-diphosphate pyrophosphatase